MDDRTTRRALLGAGLGALAATAASAVGVSAADGDAVKIGEDNSATFTTSLTNSGGGDTLYVVAQATGAYALRGDVLGGPGLGVYGYANAKSGAATGVAGETRSPNAEGVRGKGPAVGVRGLATNADGIGVVAEASGASGKGLEGRVAGNNATAVRGVASSVSGTTFGVIGRSDSNAGVGVKGYAGHASGTVAGVLGETKSTSGKGVQGKSTATSGTTYGVYGETASSSGTAVYGKNDKGRAVTGQTRSGAALTGLTETGVALRTNGRVKLEKIAGVATIPAFLDRITVQLAVDITDTAICLATPNGDPGGGIVIQRVDIDRNGNRITIVLSGFAWQDVPVAWLLIG